MRKKIISTLCVLSLLLIGCGGKNAGTESGGDKSSIKVAVVINQRFGDNGPMDDLAKGVDKASEDFGVEVKKIESESAAKFEEDIRAMSKDYDLVITTFPYMSDATKLIANEFKDTKYAAIFQFINSESVSVENIWDTEFHGEQAFYIAGYAAGKLTETNKVGLIIGGEEPTPNAEGNGFMRGVYEANPDATVEFAFVGSYEDPAKAKEITSAMVAKGVDVVQTNSGASNAGVIEASKESGILCAGEITDFFSTYEGFYGIVGIGFGETAYQAIEQVKNGTFEGGKHGIRDLSNGGYFIDWESFTRFADGDNNASKKLNEILPELKELESKVKDGSIKIEFDTDVPNWNEAKEKNGK